MFARNQYPDDESVGDEELSGDEHEPGGEFEQVTNDGRGSRQFIGSPMSSSGLSVSSRFGNSASVSQSPFPLHNSQAHRDSYSEDHVLWKGTAALVKIGSSTFSSVKCSSEAMMCHISSQFIWFIRSASRPSSGMRVDIFSFRDVSSTLALQTFEFFDANLKKSNYILIPDRNEYLSFANTLQSLGIRLSHVSLGSWLHKQNSRGVWQLRWAMLDSNCKLHYWRSKPSNASVTSAGFIDISRALIKFNESSHRAGVFSIKTNQKEVVFQADTLEAAAQWVNELTEASTGKGHDEETYHQYSALCTPFADQYKQITCARAAAASVTRQRANCVCSRRRSYATQLPDEDEFQRALDAAQDEDSEVDESMIDDLQILREVEAEEREQELKLKNMQNQAASSFFARIFNRTAPPFPAASSPSSALQSRPFQRVSSNARRNLRSGRREDNESADGYDDEEEASEVQRPSHKWQQVQSKIKAAGALAALSTNRRSASNAAVVRRDSREEDEDAYVEQGARGKGRMAQSVSKVMQSGLLRGAGNLKPKPPPPPAVEEEDDEEDLPPPASDDGDGDDDWDAPPPMEASGVQTLPPRLQGRGGSYGRSELLDMPPPPDDDDLPPPPDFEDDGPPPVTTKSNRHSRRM